jgi:hypothetical protein
MNEPYFGERLFTPDAVDATNKNMNGQPVNSDPFADKVPVDPSEIHETPMGGTVASVGPLNTPLADEVPLVETPDQEIPMGGTVAAVGPMNEAIVHMAPMTGIYTFNARVDETMPNKTPMADTISYKAPVDETITHEVPIVTSAGSLAALLNPEESEHLRKRWNEIQGKFVDEPRSAVQQADVLVKEVIGQITQMFAAEHSSLESQWDKGNDASTEDLRKALQGYRSFFNRLVV